MRRGVRVLLVATALGVLAAYRMRYTGRVDAAVLQHDSAEPVLRVTILGDSADTRVPSAREALEHWNVEFARLGRRVRFGAIALYPDTISDDAARAAMAEVPFGGAATNRLLAQLGDTPGDIIVILTHADLISFSIPWRSGTKGVAAIRRSDIPPLSLPNTVRNVVAHEVGHVIGLRHNEDPRMLMCGRPASCRPDAFVSSTPRFFPLTAEDERTIQARWP